MTLSARETLIIFHQITVVVVQQLSYHPLTATNTAHALQEWLLPHHTVCPPNRNSLPLLLYYLPSQWGQKWGGRRRRWKGEVERKGEEEFWSYHPALTPVLSIPCDLIHRHSLYQVWEAKGSFKATASGRRSIALELSLLNTEALIRIAPSTLVPTHLCP